jgi:type II secretory pathway component GspD/PulD (secretin)
MLLGCASQPTRRPISELIEEARAASCVEADMPSVEEGVRLVSAYEPLAAPQDSVEIVRLPPVRNGPLVSETFVENDVREALQILAAQARVSIIIDEQVGGVTSTVIENEPFEAALETMLLPLGCVYRRVGNQYLVGLPDPESALFPSLAERYDYYARHLSPSELLSLVPDHQKRFIRTSDKRNLMIVEAPRQIAERIVEDLRRSDRCVDQVVLEAMVCVMSPESGLRFGLDLEQGFRVDSEDAAVNLALSGLSVAGQYGAAELATVRNFTFTSAFLKALAREGYVSIRAAPRVMAKDGEMAKISIARETYFSIQPGNAQLLFRQDIEKVQAGISLDITPVIRGDHITVHIERAEVSEGLDNSALAEGQSNTFPVINRRQVSTTVHVLDGETITIGGLVQRQQVERINKLPILGNIPYLGILFQQIDRREEENEVVIFISPRIVRKETAWQEL